MRIVQCPVAMDERPTELTGLGVPGQRVMLIRQDAGEAAQLFTQTRVRVVMVVPTRHAGAFDFIAGLLVLRLEMIDKTEHEMARLPSRRLAVRPVAPEIGPQPRLDVLLANFAQKHRSSRQSRSPHPHYHQVHRYSKLLRRHDIRRS